MTRAEVLTELLEEPGVTSAAFFSRSGELLEALPAPLPEMTGFFASTRALADPLGAPPSVVTLAFGGGVALVWFAHANAAVGVVTLSSAADLNRVRSSLGRLSALLGQPSQG